MTQEEVYQFLKNNRKKWFTAQEIAEAIHVGPNTITVLMRKLSQQGYIQAIYNKSPRLYKYKD